MMSNNSFESNIKVEEAFNNLLDSKVVEFHL